MHLAAAPVRAVNYLLAGGTGLALNLGTGRGTSVKELIETIEIVSEEHLRWNMARHAVMIRRSSWQIVKTKKVLAWHPEHNLQSILQSAWQWHSFASV